MSRPVMTMQLRQAVVPIADMQSAAMSALLTPDHLSRRVAEVGRALFQAKSFVLVRFEARGAVIVAGSAGERDRVGGVFAVQAMRDDRPVWNETPAILAVPVHLYRRVVGAFVVTAPGRPFPGRDISTSDAFLTVAAVAVDNARLLDVLADVIAADGSTHRVSNLMTVVLGNIQLALRTSAPLELLDPLRQHQSAIQTAAQRVHRLRGFCGAGGKGGFPSPPAASGAGLRCLVVDDEEGVRSLLADLLGETGHTVTAVGSIPEALGLLEAGDPIDLLITDLSLPDGVGDELIRRAKNLRPALPVALVTGWTEELAELDGDLQPDLVLTKPVDCEAIQALVDLLRSRGAAVVPAG